MPEAAKPPIAAVMKNKSGVRDLYDRRFYGADEEAGFVEEGASHDTPQTRHPAYKLAFRDDDFLLLPELRPVRFQLELLKTEMLLDQAGVGSTLVMYGSARIPSPDQVEALEEVAKGQSEDEAKVTKRLIEKAKYYQEAYNLARRATEKAIIEDGERQFVVTTGGGPSIMEAGNRGASDAGGESIGLNIVLPHEQAPNPYVTPELSFNFHYFAIRKIHFLMRAKAITIFPGGFGTMDEMFETLTLIQTGRMEPIPFLLFGKEFWTSIIDFQALSDFGTISPDDPGLLNYVDTAEEAWDAISRYYEFAPE